jgi:hypothetical protein
MVTHGKDKIIQVQKPAQSLQAFQKQVATGDDVKAGYLKPLLIAAGVAVVAGTVFFGFRIVRGNAIDKHQQALATLQLEVVGNPAAGGAQAVPPQELEQRMRERLPRLEALARSAPRSERAATAGLLNTWRLELGEADAAPASPDGPWSRLLLAQKQIALGQGQEATATLASLRPAADPDRAWASLFWSTLLDADVLVGNRDQAWKDLAEYKARFKGQAEPAMDRMLAGA